ncbi:MAG: tyrosine-type recombinase/integrase [Pirellulales bacterium]
MASVEKRGKTYRVVPFINGRKVYFSLGAVSLKVAQRFGNNIDDLINCRRLAIPVEGDAAKWLAGLDDRLYALLEREGLVGPRRRPCSLGEFIDSYIESKTDVGERRRGKFRNVRDRVVSYFSGKTIDQITPGDADEYSRWLMDRFKPATAQKECQVVSQFFTHAVRKEIISRNPFQGVSVGKSTDTSRQVFIGLDTFWKVVEACPDWEWRLVAVLARIGGLRVPSELAGLRWEHIRWDDGTMLILSPKTAHHGKGSRRIPLFPELREYLEDAQKMVGRSSPYVLPMLSGRADKNLGTRFQKIIRRAGVEVWPRTFQNLRSSRQTELEEQFPTHVVCRWLGNSPKVAHKHYLQVTPDHYARAVAQPTAGWGENGEEPAGSSVNRGEPVTG